MSAGEDTLSANFLLSARRKLMRPKNDGNRDDGVSEMRKELRGAVFSLRRGPTQSLAWQPSPKLGPW